MSLEQGPSFDTEMPSDSQNLNPELSENSSEQRALKKIVDFRTCKDVGIHSFGFMQTSPDAQFLGGLFNSEKALKQGLLSRELAKRAGTHTSAFGWQREKQMEDKQRKASVFMVPFGSQAWDETLDDRKQWGDEKINHWYMVINTKGLSGKVDELYASNPLGLGSGGWVSEGEAVPRRVRPDRIIGIAVEEQVMDLGLKEYFNNLHSNTDFCESEKPVEKRYHSYYDPYFQTDKKEEIFSFEREKEEERRKKENSPKYNHLQRLTSVAIQLLKIAETTNLQLSDEEKSSLLKAGEVLEKERHEAFAGWDQESYKGLKGNADEQNFPLQEMVGNLIKGTQADSVQKQSNHIVDIISPRLLSMMEERGVRTVGKYLAYLGATFEVPIYKIGEKTARILQGHEEKEKTFGLFWPSNLSPEQLAKLANSPDYLKEDISYLATPRKIMAELSSDLIVGGEFKKQSEHWSSNIGQYALMSLCQFEKYFAGQELPCDVDEDFIRKVLALHEIGVGVTAEKHDWSNREKNSAELAGRYFESAGYTNEAIRLAKSLIGCNAISSYLNAEKHIDYKKSLMSIREAAQNADMSPEAFWDLLVFVYEVDNLASTKDATIPGIVLSSNQSGESFEFSKNGKSVKFTEETQEKLDGLQEDLIHFQERFGYNPEKSSRGAKQIIADLSKDPAIAKLYDQDAGVWEGYTVGQHTLMAMTQFEKYFSSRSGGDFRFNDYYEYGLDENNFMLLIALHDLGKARALAEGDKNRQYELNDEFVYQYLNQNEYDEDFINLATSLVGSDPIGNFLKGNDINSAAEEISHMINASKPGWFVDPRYYFNLLATYYLVDASAYTADATIPGIVEGKKSLDNLFVFDHDNEKMEFSPEAAQKIEDLKRRVTEIYNNESGRYPIY